MRAFLQICTLNQPIVFDHCSLSMLSMIINDMLKNCQWSGSLVLSSQWSLLTSRYPVYGYISSSHNNPSIVSLLLSPYSFGHLKSAKSYDK